MKKIITLIVAFLSLAINAKAIEQIVVTSIETRSNYASIAAAGNPITTPSITKTGGSPSPDITNGSINITFPYGRWYKKKPGTNSWEVVEEGVFYEGTWKYRWQFYCETGGYWYGQRNYVLSESTTVKINGAICKVSELTVGNGISYFYVDSPELTITGSDGRTEIDLIEAISTDYSQVAVIGGDVTNKPSATVVGDLSAHFETSSGSWHERWDWIESEQSYLYREKTSGTFESGNVFGEHAYFTRGYAFYCPLRVDGNIGKTHRLTENTVVKINGYECHVYGLVVGSDYSYIWVRWPDIIPKAPIPDDWIVVTSIEAWSNYASIAAAGNPITTPSITKTGGSPSPDITNGSINITFPSGRWYKKKPGANSWEIVEEGNFHEGTWKYGWQFHCETGGYWYGQRNYVLSESTTVKINGTICKVSSLVVGNNSSYFYVESPEITIEGILPTGISLDRSSLSFSKTGMTTQLTANITPSNATDKTVTWTSSHPDVATVSKDGLVTAVGEGTTTITATTVNGLTATCSVSVSVSIAATGITLNTQELVLNDVGQTYQLIPTVLPENATNKTVTWTSSHPDVATVSDDGLVTAVKEGITFIYAYTSNSKMAYCKVTVGLAKEGKLGNQGTWSFADGVLTIDYIGAMPQDCTSKTTDPEVAYRLKWIDLLASIKEVVITGVDVEVQPYFLYYVGDGDLGQHPDDHIRKLTLGSGVKKVGKQAFATYDLKNVYCYGIDPPELSSDTGGSACFWKKRILANQAFLYTVPGASTGYARINSEWANFNHSTNHLNPEDDPVGIKSIDNAVDNEGGWYTLDGRKLAGKPTQKGIYVNSGKKVMIK